MEDDQREQIEDLTGLIFCDEDCGCHEDDEEPSHLWWWNRHGWMADDVPGWANGVDTDTIWRWLKEQGKV